MDPETGENLIIGAVPDPGWFQSQIVPLVRDNAGGIVPVYNAPRPI